MSTYKLNFGIFICFIGIMSIKMCNAAAVMPAVIGEFDGEFDAYIKSWETENFVDLSIALPTDT